MLFKSGVGTVDEIERVGPVDAEPRGRVGLEDLVPDLTEGLRVPVERNGAYVEDVAGCVLLVERRLGETTVE